MSSEPGGGADLGGQGGVTADAGGAAAGSDVDGLGGEPQLGGASSSGAPSGAGAGEGGAATSGAAGEGGAAVGGAPLEAELSGLPCGVEKVLRTNCQSCHGRTPVEGTNVSLLSYADLTALSKVVPTTTVAARSLKRMTDTLTPMPPAPLPALTNADITAVRAWLEIGMPHTNCEAEPNPSEDPYEAAPTCTSGGFWPADYESGTWGMMPGRKCLECHRLNSAQAPLLSIAGTVYPTAHEPDRCYGIPVSTGAKIIITDANGVEQPPVLVVSSGNFGAHIPGLALPYRAKIVVGNTERVMVTPQTDGDCNACHSQAGTQGARGRIILP